MQLSYEQEQAQRDALEKIRHHHKSENNPAPQNTKPAKDIVITGIKLPLSDVFTLSMQLALTAVPAAILAAFVWGFVVKIVF